MTIHKDLGSGAKLFIEPSRALPLVSIVVAFRAGGVHDPAGKDGLSRITARMLRRGSEGLDASATEKLIDRLGAELGVDVAASTTAMAGQVLTRNAAAFVDLIAKLLSKPTFAQDEIDRLLRETRAELLESLDNDRGLADRFFRRKLFEGHGYGRTSRGTAATLGAIDRAAIVQQHARTYVRENLVIAMAGDVDEESAERFARTIADALPSGARSPDVLDEPKPLAGRHLVFVDKPERTQTQILIGTLGTSAHDADHVALSVANSIFGGTFTSRLTREVRGKRGWSYGASSRLGVDKRRHSFVMWTFPASSDAAPCIALELDLLAKLVGTGVTEREVKFVEKYISRSWAFEIDTAQKRVHQALDVELLSLPEDYYSRYLEHVAEVTADSANAALRARIDPKNLLVVVVGTASTTLEGVKKVMQDSGEVASVEVIAHDVESK